MDSETRAALIAWRLEEEALSAAEEIIAAVHALLAESQ